jgi:hypothetical protein
VQLLGEAVSSVDSCRLEEHWDIHDHFCGEEKQQHVGRNTRRELMKIYQTGPIPLFDFLSGLKRFLRG